MSTQKLSPPRNTEEGSRRVSHLPVRLRASPVVGAPFSGNEITTLSLDAALLPGGSVVHGGDTLYFEHTGGLQGRGALKGDTTGV